MADIVITSRIRVRVNEEDRTFGPAEFEGLHMGSPDFGGWAIEDLLLSFTAEQVRATAALNRALEVASQPISEILPSWVCDKVRKVVVFVRDLLNCSEDDLLNITGVGPATVAEIRECLKQKGLKLKGDD